jgi:hypothetical protein
VLVNMDKGRKRLEHLRNNPRIAFNVLDEADWYTHVSITSHVEELRDDTSLADIDRIARHYTGNPYPSATAAGSAPGSPWTLATRASAIPRPGLPTTPASDPGRPTTPCRDRKHAAIEAGKGGGDRPS